MTETDAAGLPVWGERVRLERLSRGWTQAELGRRVGSTRDTIARIERGWRNVPDELRIDLAEAFGLPTERMFPYLKSRQRRRSALVA